MWEYNSRTRDFLWRKFLWLAHANPFKESARFLAAEIRFGSLSSDHSRSVKRSALHPKVFEISYNAYLPLTLHRDQKKADTVHFTTPALSYVVTETTDPCVIQRRCIKPSYPSRIWTIRDSVHLTLRTIFPYTSVQCWTLSLIDRWTQRDSGTPITRKFPFFRETKGCKDFEGRLSSLCTRSFSRGVRISEAHLRMSATYVPAISHMRRVHQVIKISSVDDRYPARIRCIPRVCTRVRSRRAYVSLRVQRPMLQE